MQKGSTGEWFDVVLWFGAECGKGFETFRSNGLRQEKVVRTIVLVQDFGGVWIKKWELMEESNNYGNRGICEENRLHSWMTKMRTNM